MRIRLATLRPLGRFLAVAPFAVVGVMLGASVASADVQAEFVFSEVEDEAHVAEFEVIFTLTDPIAPSLMVRVHVVPAEGATGSLSIGLLAGAEGDLGDCGVNTPERSIATCDWPTPTAGEVGRPRLALTPAPDYDTPDARPPTAGDWLILAEASNTAIGAPADWQLVASRVLSITSDESLETVDAASFTGEYTSLVLDAAGNPVISYHDVENGDLRLVHCDDPNCADDETPQTVDAGGDTGFGTSLVLDASGNPVISYHDDTTGDLRLVHCDDPNCADGETPQTVDTTPDYLPASVRTTSLVLDDAGNPVISYYDITGGDLRLVHCDDPKCADGETTQIVDADGDTGQSSSLVLDAAGNPVISYLDVENGDLRLVHCDDPNCADGETPQTIDNDGRIWSGMSLVLDAAGNPVIAYIQDGGLRLVHCDDPNCADGETPKIVGNTRGAGMPSLVLDAAGNPVISYADGTPTLQLAYCGAPDCADGGVHRTIDGSTDANGRSSSLKLDATGNPVISYFEWSRGELRLAHCNDPKCQPLTTVTTADESTTTLDPSTTTSIAGDGSSNTLPTTGGGNLRWMPSVAAATMLLGASLVMLTRRTQHPKAGRVRTR